MRPFRPALSRRGMTDCSRSGLQLNGGYAKRLSSGLTVDVGIVHSNYSRYSSRVPQVLHRGLRRVRGQSPVLAHLCVAGLSEAGRVDALRRARRQCARRHEAARYRARGIAGPARSPRIFRRGTPHRARLAAGPRAGSRPGDAERRVDRHIAQPRSLSRAILWPPGADLRDHLRPVDDCASPAGEPNGRPTAHKGAFDSSCVQDCTQNRRAFIEADEGAFLMKATILLLGAAALALAPAFASAQTAPGNGQNNGNGYWHMNSGNANGQPDRSCEDAGGSPREMPAVLRAAAHRSWRGQQGRTEIRGLAAAEFPQYCVRFAIRRSLRQSAELISRSQRLTREIRSGPVPSPHYPSHFVPAMLRVRGGANGRRCRYRTADRSGTARPAASRGALPTATVYRRASGTGSMQSPSS